MTVVLMLMILAVLLGVLAVLAELNDQTKVANDKRAELTSARLEAARQERKLHDIDRETFIAMTKHVLKKQRKP